MDEHVFSTVLRDEAEPLRVIEPLYRALRHCYNLLKREPEGPGETPSPCGRVRRPLKSEKPPGRWARPASEDSVVQGIHSAKHGLRLCPYWELSIRPLSEEPPLLPEARG